MLRRHNAKWQLLAAGLGILVVLALLASATLSVATTVVPDIGGTYVEAVVGRPRLLNPTLSQQNETDQAICSLVFNGLTKVGPNGELEPDLAKNWTIDDGGKTYTFVLRAGLTWQDGQPVVADDVVYTVRSMQSPDYQGAPEFAELWRGVTVEKINDSTVRFKLEDVYVPFLEFTTQGIVPAHILGQVPPSDLPENAFNASPVGTGPFRVVKATLSEVVLEASDSYHGSRPFIRQLRFKFFDDVDTAAAALRQDQVQGLGRVPASVVAHLADSQRLALKASPEVSRLTLLLFNTKDPVFSDPLVRQAVAYGLDVRRLIDGALNGHGERAYGPVVPGSWAFKQDIKKYDYNPVEARSLLDRAGWVDADGDGVREKDGQDLTFVLLTNDNFQRVTVVQEIARQLAAVGFKVEVAATTWGGLVKEFLEPKNFQAVLTEQWSPNADPDCYQFWHSSQVKDGLNFGGWVNREADDLLEQGRRVGMEADRAKLYDEFQTIFAEELPGVPLFYPVYTYAVDQRVKGLDLDLMLSSADRFKGISGWYLNTKRVIGEIEIPLSQRQESERDNLQY